MGPICSIFYDYILVYLCAEDKVRYTNCRQLLCDFTKSDFVMQHAVNLSSQHLTCLYILSDGVCTGSFSFTVSLHLKATQKVLKSTLK